MGCSKLGCKISTLGALSAGKTEAPPGSKMFLETDISCHMSVRLHPYLLRFVLCAHVFRLWMCQDDKEMYYFCCTQSLCSITVYYCVNAKSERQSEMHNSYS